MTGNVIFLILCLTNANIVSEDVLGNLNEAQSTSNVEICDRKVPKTFNSQYIHVHSNSRNCILFYTFHTRIRHFSLLNVNAAGACGYDFVCDGRRLVRAYLRRRRGAI